MTDTFYPNNLGTYTKVAQRMIGFIRAACIYYGYCVSCIRARMQPSTLYSVHRRIVLDAAKIYVIILWFRKRYQQRQYSTPFFFIRQFIPFSFRILIPTRRRFEFNEWNQEPSFNFPRDERYTFFYYAKFSPYNSFQNWKKKGKKEGKKSRRSQIDRLCIFTDEKEFIARYMCRSAWLLQAISTIIRWLWFFFFSLPTVVPYT